MADRHDVNIRAAERAHDRAKEFQLKLIDAATRDAQEAMKVALAINGGAAIAVMALVGAFGSRDIATLIKIADVFDSLFLFAGGVLAAAVTAACAYLSNSCYAASHHHLNKIFVPPYTYATDKSKLYERLARRFNIVGALFVVIALVAFIAGSLFVAIGMSHLGA